MKMWMRTWTQLNSQGKNDLEMYLEWQKKVDWVFDCRSSYSKTKKLKDDMDLMKQ